MPSIDATLKGVLARFPALVLALVFGSVAQGRERADSDLDIAVAANKPLTAVEKMDIISALGSAQELIHIVNGARDERVVPHWENPMLAQVQADHLSLRYLVTGLVVAVE